MLVSPSVVPYASSSSLQILVRAVPALPVSLNIHWGRIPDALHHNRRPTPQSLWPKGCRGPSGDAAVEPSAGRDGQKAATGHR